MSSSIEPTRVYLAVPYADRAQAKAAGARWDREVKSWFVTADRDGVAFDPWRPATARLAGEPRQLFAEAMRSAGFVLDEPHPVMDGKIHRVPVEGDRGHEKNGSYRGFLDGRPNGWFQNFKAAEKPIPWKSDAQLTPGETAGIAASAPANRQAEDQRREQEADLAAQRAVDILGAAAPATTGHAYLSAKQVRSEGLFIAAPGTSIETKDGKAIDIAGRLLVPIRNVVTGAVTSLQIIDDQGGKMFLPGGKLAGGQHVIGDPALPWPLHIAEGYATAATVHEATGHAVAVAFTAHNLGLVAAQHRASSPDRSIFIDADNDHHLPRQLDAQSKPKRNVGLEAATAAAKAIDGHALIPDFRSNDPGTDWNDVARSRGWRAVQVELVAGLSSGARQKIERDVAAGRGCGRPTDRQCQREQEEVER